MLIFLTEYVRNVVLKVTGKLRGQTCMVPHGINPPEFTLIRKVLKKLQMHL
jgi:hypothetical protein